MEFNIRHFGVNGITDLKTIPIFQENGIQNQMEIFNEIEEISNEGDYLQCYTTNENDTEFTVKSYFIVSDFMGGWNLTYIGTNKGKIN